MVCAVLPNVQMIAFSAALKHQKSGTVETHPSAIRACVQAFLFSCRRAWQEA